MTNLPFGVPTVFPTIIADSTTITTFAFPEAGDCTFDINLTADCSPTITGGNAAFVQTMRLVFHTNGFTVTLPATVLGGGGLPVGLNCDLVIAIESEAGTVRLTAADAYPASAPVAVSPQPTGGVFAMNANLSGLADGSGTLPGTAGTTYPFIAASEYTYYAGKGIKAFRLPALWGRVQPGWSTWTTGSAYPAYDPTYVGYIQTALANAYAAGTTVLVDPFHNYGRLTINGTYQVFGDGVLTEDIFANAWLQLATVLKGTAGLGGYDLMNEPYTLVGGTATWVAYAQAAINAIRTVDTVTPIYVEGYQYSSSFNWPSLNPNLHTLSDPSNLLIFSPHAYADRDGSGSHTIWAEEVAAGDQLLASGPTTPSTLLAIGQSTDVAPAVTIQTPTTIPVTLASAPASTVTWQYRTTGTSIWTTAGTTAAGVLDFIFTGLASSQPGALALYDVQALGIAELLGISTCGVLDETILVRRFTPAIEWANQHGLKLAFGEFGVGNNDPAWNGALANGLALLKQVGTPGYYFTGGPGYKNYFQGIEPSNGIDTKQMAILCQAAGVSDAPTGYLLSGPERTTPGGTTTAYTVDIRGLITTPFTITPNDLGKGSTFNPPVLDVPAGPNFLGTFTVTTPSTPQTLSIGCTNTGGLTDAIAIGLSTINDLFAQLGFSAENVIAPVLYDTTHIGPAVTIYRESDGATENFFFLNGKVDQAGIASWIGSSTPAVLTHFDQSPTQSSAGIIDGNNTAGVGTTAVTTSPSQYPTYVLNAYNSLPALRFATSKMDMNSPINGLAGLTVIFVANPKSIGDGRCMISWDFVQSIQLCDSNGNFYMSNETTQAQPSGLTPGTLHCYAFVFDGTGGFRYAYMDDQLLSSQAASETVALFVYRSNLNLGYFRFADLPVNFDMGALAIFQRACTAAQVSLVSQQFMTDWGIIIPPAVSGLTLGAATTTTQALSWTLPVGAPSGTTYTVNFRLSGAATWSTAVTGLTTGSDTVQLLNANTNYDYQILSNYNGYTAASAIVTGKTQPNQAGIGRVIGNLGVNLGGLETSGSPLVTKDSLVQYFGSTVGITTYRVCMLWYNMQPTLGQTTLNATYLAQLKQVCQSCLNWGATRIILDSHDYCTFNGVAFGAAASGSTPAGPTTAQFAAYWTLLMSDPMFKNNPIFRIGLNNEPHVNGTVWYPFVEAAITSLRQAGITNQVTVAPSSGGSMSSIGEVFTAAFSDTVAVVAEGHQYWDSTNAGTAAVVNAYDYPISAALAIGQFLSSGTAMVPFWGECGFDTGSTAQAALDAFLSVCQRAGVDSITLWGGGQEFGSSYIYDNNLGNAPGTMSILQNYLPGGSKYGVPALAAAAPLFVASGNAQTFGDVGPFGGSTQALTSGFLGIGGKYSPNRNAVFPAMEVWFKVTGTAASSYILGDEAWMGIQMTSTGALLFTYGNGSRVSFTTPGTYADGKWHHAEIDTSASGGLFFVDGVKVGSSATTYANSGPQSNVTTGIGCWYKKVYNAFPGSIAEAAIWAIPQHSAAFTPRTVPISTSVATTKGATDGLVFYAPLNGNLNTYV